MIRTIHISDEQLLIIKRAINDALRFNEENGEDISEEGSDFEEASLLVGMIEDVLSRDIPDEIHSFVA